MYTRNNRVSTSTRMSGGACSLTKMKCSMEAQRANAAPKMQGAMAVSLIVTFSSSCSWLLRNAASSSRHHKRPAYVLSQTSRSCSEYLRKAPMLRIPFFFNSASFWLIHTCTELRPLAKIVTLAVYRNQKFVKKILSTPKILGPRRPGSWVSKAEGQPRTQALPSMCTRGQTPSPFLHRVQGFRAFFWI